MCTRPYICLTILVLFCFQIGSMADEKKEVMPGGWTSHNVEKLGDELSNTVEVGFHFS